MTMEQEHELIFETLYKVSRVIDLFPFQYSDEQRYWEGRRNVLKMLIERMELCDDYEDWKENIKRRKPKLT